MKAMDNSRKETLKARDSLTPLERDRMSDAIQQKFLHLIDSIQSKTIFIYVSYKSEVSTLELIRLLLARGKVVTVPLILVDSKKMLAVRLLDLESDLAPGYYGILEPKESIIEEREIEKSDIDVVVLPGSVFDEHGGRMGYGGGFYDRFLAADVPKNAKRIALAFDLQVKSLIPQQDHDQPVDYIITEKRVIERK